MKITRQFIDGPFGQVHLRSCGEDSALPPIICLHQSPKSSQEFITILPHLAKQRRVIAIDSPGHGESALPPSQDEATVESYAKSAWAVIDAFDYDKIDILGHHTGAKVAAEMAYQRGKNVRKIVMISALVLSPEEQADFEHLFQPIPLDAAGTRYSTMWARAMEYRGPNVSFEQMAASFAENLRAGEAYEWGHAAAFAYNAHFSDRVKTLPHDITVLNPKDMLFEHTPRVAPLLQNGRVIDHAEWGFGFMDVHPKDAAKAVLAALG